MNMQHNRRVTPCIEIEEYEDIYTEFSKGDFEPFELWKELCELSDLEIEFEMNMAEDEFNSQFYGDN